MYTFTVVKIVNPVRERIERYKREETKEQMEKQIAALELILKCEEKNRPEDPDRKWFDLHVRFRTELEERKMALAEM